MSGGRLVPAVCLHGMRIPAPHVAPVEGTRQRLRLRLQGVVQGVGFRPHVYRLAAAAGLSGWVGNSAAGLVVEAEGAGADLRDFSRRLEAERPPGSSIQSFEAIWLEPVGWKGFEIRPSDNTGERSVLVRPDVATCTACVKEIFDPNDRRFGYPFTNCTHCGPRYSIIEALPYDRANTSMKRFTMCRDCRGEYEDPADRRFHAQPNACPRCGPGLELWTAAGAVEARGAGALERAVEAIRLGEIVGVKGLGGFQLIVDARAGAAVASLRTRKHREEKPFAVMMTGIEQAREFCHVSMLEERLLLSPESPIVLLRRRASGQEHGGISAGVAPGNPLLGVMLPYTPLHHLLLAAVRFPVVATSGNLSDEPICIDEIEARERLKDIVDHLLVHDRPIVRHVDDSVVRVVAGRELMMRRARGYAPLPVVISAEVVKREPGGSAPERRTGMNSAGTGGVLAVGGQLKNTVALSTGTSIVLSQHVGDLGTAAAFLGFRTVMQDLQHLFGVEAALVVSDLHPDYASKNEARRWARRLVGVQHHHAHILACMAENELDGPVLGIAWDGTGYGTDGMIWGGEFMAVDSAGYERFATLRPFRLPGSERAVHEPRRSAAGLLFEHLGARAFERRELPTIAAFDPAELASLQVALERKFNAPLTTAVGRLFDAVASLLGIHQKVTFEGQAAMALESLATSSSDGGTYDLPLKPASFHAGRIPNEPRDPARDALWHVDWAPFLEGLLRDLGTGAPRERLARRFHRALVDAMVAVAALSGIERVVLSGGCFQNGIILESVIERLRQCGHRVYWHQRVPTNDGGLALGQAVAGLRLKNGAAE